MIGCSWCVRNLVCPSSLLLLLFSLTPRSVNGFSMVVNSRGRLRAGLGAASRYYDVVTEKNETVDYFGESTWADLVPRDVALLPPLDIMQEFKQPAPPPAEEQVFCSRTLNMKAIKAIGYDMDYTVVQYKWEKWEELAYECTKDVLAGYGFPVDDLSFDNPELVCRGLVIDKQHGNFLKLDRHGFVRRAMHGYKQLSTAEIDAYYGRFVVDLRLSRYSFLNTLFSVSEGVLYAQLVNKLDTGALFDDAVSPFDPSKVDTYATLYRAVSKALSRAHTHGASSLKARVVQDPEAFAQREPEKLRAMLADQRNAGKKLALITNSDWWYTDTMMRYVAGDDPDWRKLFDVVFVSARKPSFFTPDRLPCYELVVEQNKSVTPLLREMFGACKIGGVYCGGSAYLVEKLFGLSEDELLYIGDHVLHDVNSVKSSMRWRTMLVVQELQAEISAFRAEHSERRSLNTLLDRKDELAVKLNHLRCHLRRREQLRAQEEENDEQEERGCGLDAPAKSDELAVATSCQQSIAAILHAMTELDSQIEPKLKRDGGEFNTYWGYISRTGHDKSIYQRMIEKSCDIYTSKITNLLAYTPYHYFRAAPQALAHEPPSQLDAEHDLHIDDREERESRTELIFDTWKMVLSRRHIPVALLLPFAALGLYEDASWMAKFESVADFDAEVMAKDDVAWLVTFYAAEGCEPCEKIAPGLSAGMQEVGMSLGVRSTALDVKSTVGQKLAKRLNVARVPAVLAFSGQSSINPYTKKANREMAVWGELLSSGFSPSNFKRWVSKQMPNDAVSRVASREELEALAANEHNLPLSVLVTERTTTSALAKSLGLSLRGRMTLAEVVAPQAEELATSLTTSSDELPALVSLGADLEIKETYAGKFKDRQAILEWLEAYALKERVVVSPKKNQKKESASDAEDESPSSSSEKNSEEDRKSSPWGPYFTPASITTSGEFASLVLREEAAMIVTVAGTDPKDTASKIAQLDGSGVLKVATCDPATVAECEGLSSWRAYQFGLSKSSPIGDFETAKEAFEAAAMTVPSDDVQFIGTSSIDSYMQSAVQTKDGVPATGFVVFSLKDEVSIGVKAFSRFLARTTGVPVAQYVVTPGDPNDRENMDRFQVPKAPALVAFHAEPYTKDTRPGAVSIGIGMYDRSVMGPPTFSSMTAFAESLLQQIAPEAAKELRDSFLDEQTRRPPRQKSSKKNSGQLRDASVPGVFDEICGEKSAGQLCALFLLDQSRSSFETEVAVAKEVARLEASAPYDFGWVDGACHLDLAVGAFDIAPAQLPTLVVYAPKKQRFAPFVGTFDSKDIRSFLRSVVSGRIGTGPTRGPVAAPPSDKDCTVTSEPPEVVEEEDVGDLMAEILAEEAAEKKRLKEEVAMAEAEAEREKEEAEKAAADAKKKPKKKKRKKKKVPDL